MTVSSICCSSNLSMGCQLASDCVQKSNEDGGTSQRCAWGNFQLKKGISNVVIEYGRSRWRGVCVA